MANFRIKWSIYRWHIRNNIAYLKWDCSSWSHAQHFQYSNLFASIGRFFECNKKTLFLHGFYLRDASHSAGRVVRTRSMRKCPRAGRTCFQWSIWPHVCDWHFEWRAGLVQTPAINSFQFYVIDFQLKKISVFIKFIAQFKTI